MKPIFTLLLSFFLVAALSCKKDTIAYSSDYNESYRSWLDFKKKSNNSYQYIVNSGSWTGYGTETTITVRNGKVVGRSYIATQLPQVQGGTTTVLEQWTEDEGSLGSHSDGAALLTLDDIYRKAREIWLPKKSDASTYFEARNNGLISLAGYVPNGCQDDCLTGISIRKIEAL